MSPRPRKTKKPAPPYVPEPDPWIEGIKNRDPESFTSPAPKPQSPVRFPCCGGSDEHPPEHTRDCPEQEALIEQLRASEAEKEREIASLRELATAVRDHFTEHHGRDAENADCSPACGPDWDETGGTCETHRPDLPDDTCDRADECFRCLARAALATKEGT